jgi:DNA-binding NtrC family response regulator
LQTGEFQRLGSVNTLHTKVRVISATNSNLVDAIASGEFREDLYYRLNVIELSLPSLSERIDDIMPLVNHFLGDREVSLAAENTLRQHPWNGNVRELENACKRVAVLKPVGVIEAQDFALMDTAGKQQSKSDVTKNAIEPSKQELEDAMREYQGVVAKVARHFGLSRQALYRRLDKHGVAY